LFFSGKGEEAVSFYARALRAQIPVLKRHEKEPERNTGPSSGNMKGKILFAVLRSENIALMISDKEKEMVTPGNTLQLSLACPNEQTAIQLFQALSEHGTVTNPMVKHEWGSIYGELIDKFGFSWSIYADVPSK
jgi:PhnB protein